VGHREMPRFDEQAPEEIQQIRHEICEGTDMTCDLCGNAIIGPRIQCINCPDFNVCITCDSQRSIMSSCTRMDGSEHPAGHVFRIWTTADVGR
jgi:hypothetical protein